MCTYWVESIKDPKMKGHMQDLEKNWPHYPILIIHTWRILSLYKAHKDMSP